ncbi:acyl carrier protein [Streptomyces niveiscabiei]|uniref:Acyl carrier protein n=1 Tax=Streptomyces niveiscabiei TaxID=164115 RepID=A0ABW9HGE4_9ACTN
MKDILTAALARFGVTPDEVQPDTSLIDLEIDSLAQVELAHLLQDSLGFAVGDDEFTVRTTVGELLGLLDAKAAATG